MKNESYFELRTLYFVFFFKVLSSEHKAQVSEIYGFSS